MHGRTIATSDVPRGARPRDAFNAERAVARFLQRPVEQLELSGGHRRLIACCGIHPLAEAASVAFYDHVPLVLSPDAIWFTLAQGFSHHVALHCEELRKQIVRHEGKLKLTVARPDFLLGQHNPWPEVFSEFSKQIAEHSAVMHRLIVADFSTTGPAERAASEVLLMDVVQGYFDREVMCACGIPSITLLGTVDDWRSIRNRAQLFSEYGMQHWTELLIPILDEFVSAMEGKIDLDFWRSFYRYRSLSGRAEITGWINVLFPYLRTDFDSTTLVPNRYLSNWKEALQTAIGRDENEGEFNQQGPAKCLLPTGLGGAPVKVTFVDDRPAESMRFVAGMVGVSQDPDTLAVMPEFGWAVVYERDAEE